MITKRLLKSLLVGFLSFPVISNAQPKSIENNKSLEQGMNENPIMRYVIPKFEDLQIRQVHSDPKSGALRVSYNNKNKTRVSGVNAQKIPPRIEKSKVTAALTEGVEKALERKQADALDRRSFKTDNGTAVNCLGVMENDKKRSNSICFAVFDNYYVQANMVWRMEKENEEHAFSRSDGFVKAVVDRFSEYPDI